MSTISRGYSYVYTQRMYVYMYVRTVMNKLIRAVCCDRKAPKRTESASADLNISGETKFRANVGLDYAKVPRNYAANLPPMCEATRRLSDRAGIYGKPFFLFPAHTLRNDNAWVSQLSRYHFPTRVASSSSSGGTICNAEHDSIACRSIRYDLVAN